MAFQVITEDGNSRVKANVLMSDNSEHCIEVRITHDLTDDTAHEAVVREVVNVMNTKYDDEGNALPLEVTIVSITETE